MPSVDVEFAFLADAAQVSSDGKLYALGAGIDQIGAHAFPTVHPSLVLVLKLCLQPTECDRSHDLQIVLWDADGHPIGPPLIVQFSASRNQDHPTQPIFSQLILNIVNQRFVRPGEYGFYITVDGIQLKRIPLHVKELPTSNQPQPDQTTPGG